MSTEKGTRLVDSAERLHATALQAFRLGNRGRWKLCQCLRALQESRQYLALGSPSIEAYGAEHFRMSRSETFEAIRVAKELDELPDLERAFCEGRLDWTSLKELTRIARPGTEKEWLEYAVEHSTAELKAEVRDAIANQRLRPSSSEGGLPNLDQNLIVRLTRSEHERMMRGLDRLAPMVSERLGGEAVGTKEVLLFVAQWLLDTEPADLPEAAAGTTLSRRPTTELSQVLIYQRCPECQRGKLATEAGWVRVAESELDRVEANAGVELLEVESPHLPELASVSSSSPSPPSLSSSSPFSSSPASASSSVPTSSPAPSPWSSSTNETPPASNSLQPDSSTEAGSKIPHDHRDRPTPPALRRKILLRDGGRCCNPHCHRTADHCHHIHFRSKGGRTVLSNETAVCATCHALIHAGLLTLEGEPGALRWTPTSARSTESFSMERETTLPPIQVVSVLPTEAWSTVPGSGSPSSSKALRPTVASRRNSRPVSQRVFQRDSASDPTESARADWLELHGEALASGLVNLGCKRSEARQRIERAVRSIDGDWTEEFVLRAALRPCE